MLSHSTHDSIIQHLPSISGSSYDIVIGINVFKSVIKDLKSHRFGAFHHYVVITDSNVLSLYAKEFVSQMKEANLCVDLLSFPAGEENKTRETKANLEDQMIEIGVGRDACVIAMGGGVVTDMAGFVAATYMRGIPYINIPTTLLAAVDASVGGKTGVDTAGGKNLVGAFHHPLAVYIDVETFKTLPDREVQSALAEIVKHAVIADANLFTMLLNRADEIADYGNFIKKSSFVRDLVLENVKIKSKVVSQDAKERGKRKMLNFGHTIGHAIERNLDFEYSHGYCVSIGMAVEAELGVNIGFVDGNELTSPNTLNKVLELLQNIGLPTNLPDEVDVDEVVRLTYSDKKSNDSKPEYVFIKEIGEVYEFDEKYSRPIEDSIVRTILLNSFRDREFEEAHNLGSNN